MMDRILRNTLPMVVLATAMTVAAAMPALAADSNDQPALRVATVASFVPFEMRKQGQKKLTGFDIDILSHVAKRAGFGYTLQKLDFKGIIPALQTGNAELALAGITITKKRAKVVDFSDPYYQSGLKILVPSSNDKVQGIDDLKGMTVGTKIGSTSYDFLQQHLGKKSTIKPYPNSSDMYLALMSGSVEAVLYDAPNVAYFARTKGKSRVKTVGKLYQGQPYGIAFHKGSKWVKPVNKALASMEKDGTYTKLYKKWFGKKPPQKYQQ